MKTLITNTGKAAVILRAFLIYIWLTVLAELSVTDTYYSVYLLCAILGILCLYDNYKTKQVCSGKEKGILWIFSGLFSFSVVLANYSLFEPLSVLQNLFEAVCCLFGGFFLAEAVLIYLLKRLPFAAVGEGKKHPAAVFLTVFGSIALIDLLYLFFDAYPGILTTDSVSTIKQVMHDSSYNNTMPFWHTITVQLFVRPTLALSGDINAAIACFHVAQILFMAACFAYVITTLHQADVPVWFLVGVYAVYAFQPHNIVYSVTLWKDIPFSGAAVLFITALYRLLKGIGKSRVWNCVVLILGTLGFSLWRTNGWYAFLVTALLMLFLMGKRQKKLIILMTIVLVVSWLLINPVLTILGVKKTNMAEAFAVPMQQVARVVAEGRELSQQETDLLSEIFWLDKMPELYDPLTVDPIKFETFRYDQVPYILENKGEYLKLYASLGLKYPGDYLKAWIDETKGYWNGGYFFWIYTKQMDVNPYGIANTVEDNLIQKLFAAAFRYLEKPAFLQPLVSIGLHVWALIACSLINALKKREEFLLGIPLLVLVAGLWLGTPVYSEFRYAYPIILSMPLILAVTVFGKNTTKENEISVPKEMFVENADSKPL